MNEKPANSENPEDRLARLRFNALPDSDDPAPADQPQRRRCSGIARGTGERCQAWAVTGEDQCAGHLKLVPLDSAVGVEGRRKAAETRRLARMTVRDRLAHELDSDQDALVQALKDGIRLSDRKAAAQSAIRYVQLVYGAQLQKPEDERPSGDELASMPRAERDKLKRELLAEHPELAERLRLAN